MQTKKTINKKDLTEQLQRLQAEFENYKKRTEKEQEQLKDHTKAQLLLKLLNIHEDIERTKQQETGTKEAVEMVHKNMLKLLQEEQVTEIKAVGEKPDPYKHEVLIKKEGDTITEELQKGWMHKDKVLRPSKVKVGEEETK